MKEIRKAVTFSYDDGISQDKKLVELFNRYGLKATFNLNTGIQSEESRFEIDGLWIHRMNQEDIGDLYQGHEVAVHGLTHAAPVEMSTENMEKEFGTDKDNIARLYGEEPVGMAYSYGAYDENAVKFLSERGFKYGRTVKSTRDFALPVNPILLEPTCHHNDEKIFELIHKFVNEEPEEGQVWLLYIWGHSYEFDVNRNWDRIEKICRLLSGREDIFYGTNRQCLERFGCI